MRVKYELSKIEIDMLIEIYQDKTSVYHGFNITKDIKFRNKYIKEISIFIKHGLFTKIVRVNHGLIGWELSKEGLKLYKEYLNI